MGYWNLVTHSMPTRKFNSSESVNPQQTKNQFEIYQNYFSPYNESVAYDKKSFSNSIQEAKNQGLALPKDVEKSMRELAKNETKWFTPEGYLQEGLSEKDAKNAVKHRKIVNQYYERIRPKTAENQARWAVKNFIRNGFDLDAANEYSKITDYAGAVRLWGGDTSTALKGGTYGQAAAANELAFFDKLTAPQKRAYLNQRNEWVKAGVLAPASGSTLNTLQSVTDQDMMKYVRNNIQNWYVPYYGADGYKNEYDEAHQSLFNENTQNLFNLYGITPVQEGTEIWTPKEAIRITGFTKSNPTPATPSTPAPDKQNASNKKAHKGKQEVVKKTENPGESEQVVKSEYVKNSVEALAPVRKVISDKLYTNNGKVYYKENNQRYYIVKKGSDYYGVADNGSSVNLSKGEQPK